MDKITEQQNSLSKNFNNNSIFEIITLMNKEDASISLAINEQLNQIEQFILEIIKNIKKGGRLFYIGCGTSGRLGVLDASECPPTFSTDPNLVQGIIAGGYEALYQSIEGAEDSLDDGVEVIKNKDIKSNDIVLGISANGAANFVLGALEEAFKNGATTGLLTFNNIDKKKYINYLIPIITGPELISGSTRLKAGTATKMILNMITTTTMIKLNKTYNNFMVDLKVSNKKLLDRGIKIINNILGLDYKESKLLLNRSKGEVKTALAMHKLNCNYDIAKKKIDAVEGNLSKILD
jgi:N-acetylmuramic acid 6-phosphate etherase